MDLKNTVRVLLSLSEGPGGVLDASRAEAVCRYVREKYAPSAALKILRAYRRKAEAAVAANSAKIASAGGLDGGSKEALEAFVRSKNESAQIEFVNDAGLIAGVKVVVGDTVWENSVRMKLEELKQSLGA